MYGVSTILTKNEKAQQEFNAEIDRAYAAYMLEPIERLWAVRRDASAWSRESYERGYQDGINRKGKKVK